MALIDTIKAEYPGAVEVVDKRTKDSKTFDLGNGSFRLVVQPDIHYRAAPGQPWVDTDLTIQQSAPGTWVRNGARVQIACNYNAMTLFDQESRKSFMWVMVGTIGGWSGTTITYDGVPWQYIPTPTGVKSHATVATRQGVKTYAWNTGGNPTNLHVDADGNLTSVEFHIPRAFLIGADGVIYEAGAWTIPTPGRAQFTVDDRSLPAAAFPYVIDPTTTVTSASGADDGYAATSGSTIVTNTTTLSMNATTILPWIRVPGLAIPQGSVITSALLTLNMQFRSGSPSGGTIQAFDEDNATNPTTADDRRTRALTTATVTGYLSTAPSSGAWTLPDASAIVQEVVDRSGWASGNAIAFAFTAGNGAACNIWTYDQSASYAASLSVTYVEPVQTLTPALLTNTSTLYAAALAASGSVDLAPSMLTNTSTIYAPTLSETQRVHPALLSNTSTLYAPTLAPSGSAPLAPALLTNVSTLFYAPTMTPGTATLTPALLMNISVLFVPAVAHPIIPGGSVSPPITVSIMGALPDAAPLAAFDINPAVESIQITKQTPGGFATLDLGFALNDDPTQPVPYLSQPIVAERRSHIVVRIGGRIEFEGVPTFVNPAGQLQAEGYGLASPNWGAFTQDGDEPVDVVNILAEAVRLSPFLVPVQIDDPGGQRTWGEFQYQSPASVLNALTMAGDASTAVPLVFTVYEGRATRIVAAIPPDVPDYQVSYDSALMQLGWDEGDCIDGVAVAWTDADGVQQITDTLYRDGVDASSAVVVPTITASFPDAGAALQYATVYLAEHAEPRLSGTIRLGIDDLLQRPNGEQVPGYMVAAGEWISIGGQGKAPITSVTVTAGPVTNQQTGAVVVVSSVEIQVGSPPSSSWIAAQRRAMDASAAYRADVDANSGNRR